MEHLVSTKEDMHSRGWKYLDIVLVTGDANVDHPSFPANLLGRLLEAKGYRTGILSRPDLKNLMSIRSLGLPRLFFGVTAGALDSMVANYTAQKRRRSDDPYAPDGKGGGRPDRALTVYCNLIRRAYKKSTFIVAGGLEASLRRFAHYDYWSDSTRRSILMDCGADVLVYGMGERSILSIAEKLNSLLRENPILAAARSAKQTCDASLQLESIKNLPGLVYREAASLPQLLDGVELPSTEDVQKDDVEHARAYRLFERHRDRMLWQNCSGMRVIANPPAAPLTTVELDEIYSLPFTRDPHPSYGKKRIPALEQVRFSVTTHRGCFGGCAFCAIGSHQGKEIQSREPSSIIKELRSIIGHPQFKGTVPDMGGPTANMYGLACRREKPCSRPSCLWPEPCKFLNSDQRKYLNLLRRTRKMRGIKHLYVTTGIRMDLAMQSRDLLQDLAFEHTSGHLKVAPEHISPNVLKLMRKPMEKEFGEFISVHRKLSKKVKRRQYVLPYLMAAHPGCGMKEMVDLALFLRNNNIRSEQCQIFTPTPGTAATVMYATGLDPDNLKPVKVERDPKRKQLQKALILYHLPESGPYIREALASCGMETHAPLLLSAANKKPRKISTKGGARDMKRKEQSGRQ